jgi:hypothetical protein
MGLPSSHAGTTRRQQHTGASTRHSRSIRSKPDLAFSISPKGPSGSAQRLIPIKNHKSDIRRMRRLALATISALFVISSVAVLPADAGTPHHRHHHKHSAKWRAHHRAQLRAKHRRHMHHLLVKRLHHSMPDGVGFHRFFDHRTHSSVHVATIHPGAHVRLRPVPASTALHKGALVRTSRMCKRVHCLLAVNGSFRDLPSRLPRGAEIVNGVPLKLEANQPRQAVFSPRRPVAIGRMHTDIRLHQDGLGTVRIHRVNMRPGRDGAALFTAHYGPRSSRGVTARITLHKSHRLRLGRDYRVDVHTPTPRSTRSLHPGELALVTHGQSAWKLRWFARHVDRFAPITLSTSSPAPAPQSLGTSFRLLRDTRVAVPRLHWHLVRGREPRTILATKPDGTVMLITVDGRRRHSWGASMQQAAYLARRLGATQAVNLDGGGSTTFVARGHVLNHPSEGFERGVVNGLVVVRSRHAYDPHYRQRLQAQRAARRAAAAAAVHEFHAKLHAAQRTKLRRLALRRG